MLPLRDLLRRDPPTPLAVAVGFIHTIEIFWSSPFRAELKNALRLETGRQVWDDPVIIDESAIIGWKLKLNRPTRRAIEILQDMWEEDMSICRLDIAYDLDLAAGVSRDHIRGLIYYHARMRHGKASDRPMLYKGTIYLVDFRLRQGRISKAGLYYDDKPGDLDGEDQKPHIEIRLLTGAAVKRGGIYGPHDMLEINPREFFKKRMVMKDHVGKVIREAEKTVKPHPLVNVERRICGIMARCGSGTLADYKQQAPRKYEKLAELSLIDVQEALEWVPAKGCEREKVWGKFCTLSQANVLRRPIHRERLRVRERL